VLCTVHFVLFMFYSISYYDGFMKCLYVNRYVWSSTSISPYNQLSTNAHVFETDSAVLSVMELVRTEN